MELVDFNRTKLGRIIRDLLLSFLLAIIYTSIAIIGDESSFRGILTSLAWAFAICSTQWVGHSQLFSWLDRKYPWDEVPKQRTILGVITIILYAVLAYMAVTLLLVKLVYGRLPDNPLVWGVRTSLVTILVSFAVSLIFLAYGFFRSWKQTLLEAERFKQEMLMYKYEALQNQINPHFLFNSFNVLTELVYENREKAVRFISQLSGLFRYVLDSRDKELVRISEELEFIRSFAFLLQTRFEDKLTIAIDVQSAQDEMIVPMTLQMLVENCVKHNEISEAKPLTIQISRINSTLNVTNNLQEKPVSPGSNSTGLANLKQQYGYFTDRELVVEKRDSSFSVDIPILKVSGK